jgi:hypothetical protein
MARNVQSAGTCLCLRLYTALVILSKPPIIVVSKITLKIWNKSMRIVMKGCTASFALMSLGL